MNLFKLKLNPQIVFMLCDSYFMTCFTLVKHNLCILYLKFCDISMIVWYAVLKPVNFSEFKSDVPILNGENYKVWKESILLQLGCMDIDYAIRKDEPPALTDTSTAAEIAFHE